MIIIKKVIALFFSIVLVLSVLFSSSCFDREWETIKAGIETNINGSLYDYNLQSRIVNAKIYIEEYIDHPDHDLTFNRYIDSTYSDNNGKYSIEFTTTGVGVQYKITFLPDAGARYWTYLASSPIIKIGSSNVIDFNAAKLTVLESRLLIVDNLHPPLRGFSTYGQSFYDINKKDSDTTVFFYLLPNNENVITFFNIVQDTIPTYVLERFDTVDLRNNFEDTVRVEFQLHPKEFKKRI